MSRSASRRGRSRTSPSSYCATFIPSRRSASLRVNRIFITADRRLVRIESEQGGKSLRGICDTRLPSSRPARPFSTNKLQRVFEEQHRDQFRTAHVAATTIAAAAEVRCDDQSLRTTERCSHASQRKYVSSDEAEEVPTWRRRGLPHFRQTGGCGRGALAGLSARNDTCPHASQRTTVAGGEGEVPVTRVRWLPHFGQTCGACRSSAVVTEWLGLQDVLLNGAVGKGVENSQRLAYFTAFHRVTCSFPAHREAELSLV
jgi:hypothetical protein